MTDNNQQDCCHIKLKTGPQRSTPLVSILCDCNKIELFTGDIEEYINVFYGELLDEFDGTKSYIFEFKFPKNISELLLKVKLFACKINVIAIVSIYTYICHTLPYSPLFYYSLSQMKSRFGSMAYTCT